jgi:hypothetical protein
MRRTTCLSVMSPSEERNTVSAHGTGRREVNASEVQTKTNEAGDKTCKDHQNVVRCFAAFLR